MTTTPEGDTAASAGNPRLAILLAMAFSRPVRTRLTTLGTAEARVDTRIAP